MIAAEHISRVFRSGEVDTIALRDVSLTVAEGEFVAIMGPSGSGKSSLLHIFGLLDRPTGGSLRLAREDIFQLSDQELAERRNARIGFVFQAFHLLARATVLDNVMLPLLYSRVPSSEHQARAEAALQQVGMTHRLKHQPNQLSGGEKQRVAIARALVLSPRLILADEPTGNLDTASGQQVMKLIDELHRQGHTVLLITHEQTAADYAERVVTMRDGTIVGDERLTRPHRHYAK
ncbi:MAG: ABC transporter ATP-binding protein [Candidatus Andersenbacteria bacterium]|nr:ABC transporter ATP-binding protein [Candidatus Andersenbacteria bacterium]